mgnify:CR=1 FL=1
MTKDTNLFQDAWAGWVNFVREVTSFGPPKKGLKPKLKPRIMVPLKRDLKKLRRPQPEAPKRTKVEIRKEKTKLKREAVQQVPELKGGQAARARTAGTSASGFRTFTRAWSSCTDW